MQIRIVRLNVRNPLVGAALLVAGVAIIVALLVLGLTILAGLALVGAVALLARRLRGARRSATERSLDPGREVFAATSDQITAGHPPGAEAPAAARDVDDHR